MIAAISWVPKGASKSIPTVAEPPSIEEIEDILKSGVLERPDESENEEKDEDMNSNESQQNDKVAHALAAADALGKASKSVNPITDSITDALKDLEMDNYDEEDDGIFMELWSPKCCPSIFRT
ncbi:Transducin/WD40 repeat-like superfamily protein [Forsythia ovata]|uniref:Transducin/WD40 repeat-like superfamily protein n=1 Tax=Forsythia ovata TaxID=205694 RepID=A0ABD1X8A0_9LAMI